MFKLSVIADNKPMAAIPFAAPANLFRLLSLDGATSVRSACQGKGSCGLCLVRIEHGECSALTSYEKKHLREEQIAEDVRLACQVTLFGDTEVVLINPLITEGLDSLDVQSEISGRPIHYTVAVDLGSTQIRMSLWDKANRRRIAAYCGFNPQACYGSDILNRLTAASTNPAVACELSRMVLDTIEHVVTDWISQKKITVSEILIVGNTAMLALVANKHSEQLLQPRYWTQAVDCSLDITDFRKTGSAIATVRPIAGFIGSDILAGLLAVRLADSQGSALFIDFGTNTEMALWHNNRLWLTSVPGGPAFEGYGISCGVAAEPGAVANIVYDADNDVFYGEAIGSGAIKGLCGSALCDAIACSVAAGRLKKNGRLAVPAAELEFDLSNLAYRVRLAKKDVDVFQRAKAAVGAGIAKLLIIADVSPEHLQRICIAGSFGQYLTVNHAQAIGLLPDCAQDKVELCGNAALNGCELLLSDPDRDLRVDESVRNAEVVNLSQVDSYEDLFIDHLYLQPMALK